VDAETLTLLGSSLRSLLTEGGDVVQGLDDLGWQEVLDEDEAAATTLLFTEQGATLARSRALDAVVTRALGVPSGTVVHPAPGGAGAPWFDGDVDGVLLVGAQGPFLVPGEAGVRSVEELVGVPVGGFDPDAGLVRVTGSVQGEVRDCEAWSGAVAAARRALASELVGLGRAALDLAVEQVCMRQQFGKAIGSLQSPRHRLAEAHVALSAAENLIEQAWTQPGASTAIAAKAQAGKAAELTASAALQVCGAIGLTSEHRLGGYVRRAFVVDSLYGSWRDLSRELGRQLLAS
jgi:hypothetical protein